MPLNEAFEKANITSEEADKFVQQFKDPKFRQLFEEYAKEISNPQAKAEHDAYLAQIETEGQAEAMYGKGVQLIIPEPGLVVKTKDAHGKIRVYINICTSNKIDKFSEQQSADPSRPGVHLSLPTALDSKTPKVSSTADGGIVHVWDLALHPAALQEAAIRASLMHTLIIIAIERVESVSGTKLMRHYKLPKLQYKATGGQDKPSVMTVRTSDGSDVVDGRIRPKTEAQGATQAAAAADSDNTTSSSSNVAGWAGQSQLRASRSSFSFGGSNKEANNKQPQEPPAAGTSNAGYRHECGAVTPEWDLVERGSVDLGQAWQDRGLGPTTTTPQALVLRVQLPGVTSAAALHLDVNSDSLQLHVPGKYLLDLQLKHPVKDQEGTARYDKAKQQLTITLPVMQPDCRQQLHLQQQQQHDLVTHVSHSPKEGRLAPAQQQKLQEPVGQGKQQQEPFGQEEQRQEPHSSAQSPTSVVTLAGQLNQQAADSQLAGHMALGVDAAALVTAQSTAPDNITATKTVNELQWELLHKQLDSEQKQHDQRLINAQQQQTEKKACEAAARLATSEQKQSLSMLKPRLQSRHITASMLD